VAEISGSDAPFDPAFLDIPAMNRALAEQFLSKGFGEKTATIDGRKQPFCRHTPYF
jgi:hypothetical protein